MNDVILIAGGVLLGNVLTFMFVYCMIATQRQELAGDTPRSYLYWGIALPAIFGFATVYLGMG